MLTGLKPSLLPVILSSDSKLSARAPAAIPIVYGGINVSFRAAKIKNDVTARQVQRSSSAGSSIRPNVQRIPSLIPLMLPDREAAGVSGYADDVVIYVVFSPANRGNNSCHGQVTYLQKYPQK